jgi:bifunctional non-homologous end joining protein LigD
MLATLTDEAFDNKDWLFELKLDGYRAIANIDNGNVELYSRNKISFNDKYPDVVEELSQIGNVCILDGEIVAEDEDGMHKFQWLQNYGSKKRGRLVYYIFDLLYLDGYELFDLPLHNRKELLKQLIPENDTLKYLDHIENDGIKFFDEASGKGYEGIIGKLRNSKYYPGKRSKEWLKIKAIKTQEAIICGFTEPRASRKHFGALILGVYKDDELIYIGHTGGGFNDEKLQSIKSELDKLISDHSPFSDPPKTNMPVTWVKPELICEVKFSEWTKDGIMRHPIFLRLREDKQPEQIKKELPEMHKNKSKIKKSPAEDMEKFEATHPDKIYFPQKKITKGQVLEYYDKVSKMMMPFLMNKPHSLKRNPNGIKSKAFFQKDIDFNVPDFVRTEEIYSDSVDKDINYIICENKETLLYMVNLGCIEINPWLSKYDNMDNPDFIVIDLDPLDVDFGDVIDTAKCVKEVCDEIKVTTFVKTSGSKGIHILIPLLAKYEYDIARNFCELIVRVVNNRIPDITSIERSPKKRKNKVYLDYLQNKRAQTITAPYSLRPFEEAPISTPLHWKEVKSGLTPRKYTYDNIFRRLSKTGDIFEKFFKSRNNIEKSIKILDKL